MKYKQFSKVKLAEKFLDSIDKHLYIEYNVNTFPNSEEEEEDKYFTHYFAKIYLENNNIDSNEKEQIGTMSFTRLSFAYLGAPDIFWIFDSDNLYSRLYDRLYDKEQEDWLIEEMQNAFSIWLMNDVVIMEKYRGKGIVQLLMLDKMKKFFSHNDFIFAFAFPLQFDKSFLSRYESKFLGESNKLSFEEIQEKLKKSYKDVGYKYLLDLKNYDKQNLKIKQSINNEKKEDNKLIYFLYQG